MIDWGLLVGRLVSMIMSWLQAGNLRAKMYVLEEENELMRTALEDIQRMDAAGRLGWHAKRTLDQLESKE